MSAKADEEPEERRAAAPRRWLVVGSSGAGKTRFSRALSEILGLPVIHLDRHYWRGGWIEPGPQEWRDQVAELASGEAWVMDGNYSSTLDMRLARAHEVVFLDIPVWRCVLGIYRRSFEFRGRVRPDLAEGCPEQLPDAQFLHYVVTYKLRSRPKVLRRIAEAPHVRLHRLRSRPEADAFLLRVSDQVRAAS